MNIKEIIKKLLARVGLYNPALLAKIGGEAKAAHILANRRTDTTIFVETGTNRGDMIFRLLKDFTKFYSIELDPEKYANACERFKGNSNVKVLQGDSAIKIKEVLDVLSEPAVFWLDAHGSTVPVRGEHAAPIEKELIAIFNHPIKNHVILIDDARHFDREGVTLVKSLAAKNQFEFLIRDGLFILKRP